MLKREEWYDLATRVDWNFKYVKEEEVFPPEISGYTKIPREVWVKEYDAPYKVTYREYVKNQRDKDTKVLAVRDAAIRGKLFEKLDRGLKSNWLFHYGAVPLAEYQAAVAEARMARFGRAAEWRHLATFGNMDEIRHAQLQLLVPHAYVQKDPRYAWAHKCFYTEEWGSIAARKFFDDQFTSTDALETSIQLTFLFETAFTNLQFIAMASQSYGAGDYEFGNMVQSIQTDEARHAQIGVGVAPIMVKHGEGEKFQKMVDKMFWTTWRVFCVLVGCTMDYQIPVEARRMSFKEFMEEWIIAQFQRLMRDLGYKLPWYWDLFVKELDYQHHSFQIGLYCWRPTIWFDRKGPSPEERKWLRQKYPDWEDKFGPIWDTIIKNILDGKIEKTLSPDLVVLCNGCNLPICFPYPGETVIIPHIHNNRPYLFCSEPCKWIFEQEPEKFAGQKTLLDRALMGEIPDTSIPGIMKYMGFDHPEEMGDDSWNYEWARAYAKQS